MNPFGNKHLFVTDFDGTLAQPDGRVSASDLESLEKLGRMGVLRCIATGRSLFSFKRTVKSPLPVDFIIFSTGGGVITHPEEKLIRSSSLSPEEVDEGVSVMMEADLDFMIHEPVPNNHCFLWRKAGPENSDFEKRISLYPEHHQPYSKKRHHQISAAQLLAILPNGSHEQAIDFLRKRLPHLTVVRTTSPLDGRSAWIEVFPKEVSKSRTTAWLAQSLNIKPGDICAVGNDYNDQDLLEWAGVSFLVENGPEDLKERFPLVPSNERSGVSWAIKTWLGEKT